MTAIGCVRACARALGVGWLVGELGSGVVSSQKWYVFLSNIFRHIQSYSHIIHVDSLIREDGTE